MKIRKQTYALGQYLKLILEEKIRTDQECQRRSGQWNANMINELIATVLTDNYIPPIILGEEVANGITRQWIIDGLQRSTSLSLFRYGNAKITKNVDEYMVTYQRKSKDENGKVKRDEKGELIWESVEYDIRNKTYDQLPPELKDRFNDYQIELAIHQDCDISEISKLVRKYNNHTSMNRSQRAFTYIDTFAREIRDITENSFFLNMYSWTHKERINGTLERVAGDMVLLSFYPSQFRNDAKTSFKWLNENATMYDFSVVNKLLTRLEKSTEITPEIRGLFTNKHAHIFVAAFKAFTELGREDKEFNKFLHWFIKGGKATKINGKSWEDMDLPHSTRDRGTVQRKLDYLVALINQHFSEH